MNGDGSAPGLARGEAVSFPLSFAQQRLWFLDQLSPGNSAYNVPLVLRLSGRLNEQALELALGLLIDRHESLRTTFLEDGGEAVQIVQLVASPYRLAVLDLIERTGSESSALARAREEADRPFDLTKGPLFRTLLIRQAEEEHLLVLTLHHIVADAWSLRVLRRDLAELYGALAAAREPELPELPVHYGDFAVWQREWFQGERLEEALAQWREELRDAPGLLDLPFDRPRPAEQSDRGANCRAVVGRGLVGHLEAVSQAEGATLFMTLLAAFSVLLSRYSAQDDVVVGTPIANRNRVELEELIGFFANTLALRVDLGGRPTFRELLRRTRETALRAYSTQDLPFEKLVAEMNPERSLSHSPLFQVLFQFHEAGRDVHELPGLTASRVELDRGHAKFDLALTLTKSGDGLRASFEYSTDLFDESTVERLLANFEMILQGIAADPDRAIDDLEILSAEERIQLERWNDTRRRRQEFERPVHLLFEEQVLRTPNAVSIEMGSRSLSYAELNARANSLALRLREAGVGPDVPVAICVERSIELPVAVLAVLKAGGAYAPLDPSYPAERLRFMLDETAAPVLITQTGLMEHLPEHHAQVIHIEGGPMDNTRAEETNLAPIGGLDDLAYILFTSGSTGRPKGVAMPHATLSNMLAWQRDDFSSSPTARTLQFASLSFDVAFQELFSTWISGGTLILVDEQTRRDPEALLTLLSAQNVERLFVPFVALEQLADASLELGIVPRSLREVITAGEALQVTSSIREFFARLPGCTLQNQYGPTESHVVTAFTLEGAPERWPDRPPIGRPIANARVRILDERGRLAPVGVPGELHIGGDVLARGYLGRLELTEERFVRDRFASDGGRLYRTGDRARVHADGNIEFLGRLDHQVKIRGYRIEPGEIESALNGREDIRQAVVVAREDTPGNRRLVAYIVPREPAEPTPTELKGFLRLTLPEFMVPSAFVTLATLPLGPTGKVDRRALPAPGRSETTDEGLVLPRDEVESALAGIWQELLGLETEIGVRDDFFELGGHSLLSVQLMALIEEGFGARLPLATLFDSATIEALAERVVEARSNDAQWQTLFPLRATGSKPPLFLLHGHDGELLFFRDLVRRLEPDQPAFGVQPVGLDGSADMLRTVNEMAAHYANEILAFRPEGPHLLVGYCYSGVLAYEVAYQLQQRGQAPALVALIDAAPRGRRPSRGQLERRKLSAFLATDARGRLRWITRRSRGIGIKATARTRRLLYDLVARSGRRPPKGLMDIEGTLRHAMANYVTPSSRLPVTLFHAGEDGEAAGQDWYSRWSTIAGKVEVHPIVAEGIRHDNILREPYVALLADELGKCVREALERPRISPT